MGSCKTDDPARPSRSQSTRGRVLSLRGGSHSAAKLCSPNGVGHQHGDGERANASRDRRESACLFASVFRLNVADQDRTFLSKLFQRRRRIVKNPPDLFFRGQAVDADIDDGGPGPDEFARREVPVETPVREGWFVMKGFSAEEPVVVSGAQLLLSKEFLPVRPKEEEED